MDITLKFNLKIYKNTIISNFIIGLITAIFIMLFINPSPQQIHLGLILGLILIIVDLSIVSPVLLKIQCNSLSKKLLNWEENGIDTIEDRTDLFEDIMDYPKKNGVISLLTFIISSIIMVSGLHFIPFFNFSINICLLAFIPCITGSVDCYIISLYNCQKVCDTYSKKLILEGIDNNYVMQKKQFGMSLKKKTILYLVFPILTATILTLISLISCYQEINNYIPTLNIKVIKIICGTSINIGRCILFCILYYKYLTVNNTNLQKKLEEVLKTGEVKDLQTSNLADQLQYNIYLFNILVHRFNDLISKSSEIGDDIRNSTDNLSVIAKQLSTTSFEQSANIKEILSTMEDSNAFSQNIADKINNVSLGTDSAKDSVEIGFDILNENIAQMQEIKKANDDIIYGIENLTTKINNIDNIITIIKDIADQTRIIAFNAELEAVSAADEGKNFHIVAIEIRRLANNTMNSINEIQKYISKIKLASESLINLSQDGTNYIQKENSTITDLETHFKSIKDSANNTSQKTSDITCIIQQQSLSFSQILITLRQISASIENFTDSTGKIKTISDELVAIAQNLDKIHEEKLL